jgi:hypothetical protein
VTIKFHPDLIGGNYAIYTLDDIPKVDFELLVKPDSAWNYAEIAIFDNTGVAISEIPLRFPNKFITRLTAGVYRISCKINPKHETYKLCCSDYASTYDIFIPPNDYVVEVNCE